MAARKSTRRKAGRSRRTTRTRSVRRSRPSRSSSTSRTAGAASSTTNEQTWVVFGAVVVWIVVMYVLLFNGSLIP